MTKLRREQIAGANYHYTRYPLSYFIGSMQKNGIHKIEFYAAAPHLYVFDYEPAEVKAIKKQLDAAQIDVICFTAEQCFYPISIAMDDSRVRERSIRYYERALEQAAVLESPRMQMISGAGLNGSDPAEDWKRSADAIHQIVKKAESLGITIVLEADYTCTVKSTADIRRMIDEIGSKNFSGMIDTNGLYYVKDGFEESVELLGEDLRHFHFIDIRGDDGCLIPGDGDLPMDRYLDYLAAKGYEGYLTPELWGGKYCDDPDAATKKCLEYCFRYTE